MLPRSLPVPRRVRDPLVVAVRLVAGHVQPRVVLETVRGVAALVVFLLDRLAGPDVQVAGGAQVPVASVQRVDDHLAELGVLGGREHVRLGEERVLHRRVRRGLVVVEAAAVRLVHGVVAAGRAEVAGRARLGVLAKVWSGPSGARVVVRREGGVVDLHQGGGPARHVDPVVVAAAGGEGRVRQVGPVRLAQPVDVRAGAGGAAARGVVGGREGVALGA